MANLDPYLPAPSYKEHSKLCVPKSWERLQNAVEEALRTGTPYELDLEMVRTDGTRRWFTARGEGQRDTIGRIVQLRGTVQDITDRKQAEDALRASEEKFSGVFRSSPVAMAIHDLQDDGRFVDINEAFERLNGYGRDEVIGHTPLQIALWADPHGQKRMVEQLQSDCRIRNLVHCYRKKSGNNGTGLLSVEILHIGGKPYAIGTVVDITERQRAEAALRESEERFRLVANTAPVMVWMTGVDILTIFVNQRWLDFTGRPLEAELGNGWAEIIHPEDRQGCLEAYTHALAAMLDSRLSVQCQRLPVGGSQRAARFEQLASGKEHLALVSTEYRRNRRTPRLEGRACLGRPAL